MRLRFAFFDAKHSLQDVIPEQLLGPNSYDPLSFDEHTGSDRDENRYIEDLKWAKTIPKKEFPV